MTAAKYNKVVKEAHLGLVEAAEEQAEFGYDCGMSEMAFEFTTMALEEYPWIKKFLSARGVRDIEGRLADDIYSGHGV